MAISDQIARTICKDLAPGVVTVPPLVNFDMPQYAAFCVQSQELRKMEGLLMIRGFKDLPVNSGGVYKRAPNNKYAISVHSNDFVSRSHPMSPPSRSTKVVIQVHTDLARNRKPEDEVRRPYCFAHSLTIAAMAVYKNLPIFGPEADALVQLLLEATDGGPSHSNVSASTARLLRCPPNTKLALYMYRSDDWKESVIQSILSKARLTVTELNDVCEELAPMAEDFFI